MIGDTAKPRLAYSMAGSNSFSNGSLPNLSEISRQAETAPGTVTDSQPRCGMASAPAKRSGDHAAGEGMRGLLPTDLIAALRRTGGA